MDLNFLEATASVRSKVLDFSGRHKTVALQFFYIPNPF